MSSKRGILQVVTANDLIEGDAVWFTAAHTWSRSHGDAAVVTSSEEADALLSEARKQQAIIADAYLADAVIGADGRPAPSHFREAFRTRGPSNRFHGKQAES